MARCSGHQLAAKEKEKALIELSAEVRETLNQLAQSSPTVYFEAGELGSRMVSARPE